MYARISGDFLAAILFVPTCCLACLAVANDVKGLFSEVLKHLNSNTARLSVVGCSTENDHSNWLEPEMVLYAFSIMFSVASLSFDFLVPRIDCL